MGQSESYTIISGQSYFGDSPGSCLEVTSGAVIQTIGTLLGPCGSIPNGEFKVDSGGTLFTTSDQFIGEDSNGCDIATAGGTIFISQDLINQSLTTGGGSICNSGGTANIHINNSQVKNSNTGGYSFYISSGGINLYDACGNTFSGLVSSGLVTFGNCSITGTAFSTSSFVLTSGWGSSTKASATGDSQSFNFVITGASGSSGPIVTVTFPTAYLAAPNQCTITQTSGTFGVLTNPVIGSLSATGFTITWSGTPAANTYGFSGYCR
jgi:hypothetical protein